MTLTTAEKIMGDAIQLWEDALLRVNVTQDQVDEIEGALDIAGRCLERCDWTGAWLAAGTVISRVRAELLPATA